MQRNPSDAEPMPTSNLDSFPTKWCNNLGHIWACVCTGQGLALRNGRKRRHTTKHTQTHAHMCICAHTSTEHLMQTDSAVLYLTTDVYLLRTRRRCLHTKQANPCLHCAAVKTEEYPSMSNFPQWPFTISIIHQCTTVNNKRKRGSIAVLSAVFDMSPVICCDRVGHKLFWSDGNPSHRIRVSTRLTYFILSHWVSSTC